MKIAYSAEDTIDLPKEYLEKWNISTVSFHFEKDGKQYYSNEVVPQEGWSFTEQTGKLCHTSAVNVDEVEHHFAKLKENHDKIIHFTISSGLSSGYQNAWTAKGDDPDIYLVDSHFTSGVIALLVLYAQELEKQGLSFEQICQGIEERKKHYQGSMIISTTNYLYKGGRCSKLANFGANLLKLRPIIVPDKDGRFTTGKKYIGPYAKCVHNYVKDLLQNYENIDKKRCFFNYAGLEKVILEDVLKMLKDFGFEEIYSFHAGVTNAYHAGPGACGLMFFYGI